MSIADAGRHGARDRHVLHVDALGRGRLGADDLIHERGEVRGQRIGAEANLANGRMHIAALVDAELDLSGLDLAHRALDVEGDGAGLRVPASIREDRARDPAVRPVPSDQAWR